MFRDILVPLVNVPEADAASALDGLVRTVGTLEGAATGLAVEIDFAQPVYVYADAVAFMYDAFRDAEKANDAHVERLARQFEQHSAAAAVTSDIELVRAFAGDVPGLIARRARLHDLTLFVVDDGDSYLRGCIESVIFGAGRPVLVLPRAASPVALKKVVVAWDFSREAARALTDAMPILRQAEAVTLLHVSDDGAALHPGTPAIQRHLGRSGIDARYVEVARGTLSVHQALEEHARHNDADLVVMGAYGHTRLREFILGGVTRDMLKAPYLPVLMSH
ncbi:MAG: universal stress protein [Sphingomonadales bacterium]